MHQDAGEPGAPPRLLLVGERAWLETPRSAFGDDATFVTATTTESAL